MKRTFALVGLAAVVIAPACSRNKTPTASIQTAAVQRRDIVIDAQANGVVEPINVVEVKSKASGMITQMNVETGALVKPGDLLVQVDTRDVQNQYNQAKADEAAAEARLEVSEAQKRRSDEMFKAKVITAQEHETAALDYANARAALIRARANTDLAQQRLDDARVTAPVAGTIIERTVSQGMVITSATGGSSTGGTTLLKMADLTRVRMRAQFNETDIGQIRSGQPATVIVDAYPDRRFTGLVEKIEPQAVVQQGVTMFPVLVTLSNVDGALKPGMNGEVQVEIDRRMGVLSIPNDAVKNMREAIATAPLLGLDPDSVQAELRASRGGFGNRGPANTAGAQPGAAAGSSTGARQQGGARTTLSPGEVALPQQGPGQGGRFQMPQVTDEQCAAVTTVLAKKPTETKKLDALREQMRDPAADRGALREEQQKIYAALGVDARTASACRMRSMQAGMQGGQTDGAQRAATNPAGGPQPQLQIGSPERGRSGRTIRPGLVFVVKGKTYEPRSVMLGAGNFDYTEVVSGLQEGEEVALLASLSLQAQRQQQTDRFRQNMGGGVPGMGGAPAGGGGRTGGR
ncbi:MAG TPA: efflux RND transporter periplasmic adaptor subunit [Gemmatimonadaceae bacterium]|nr:efflux RND transporter periplasmic adaptor subunit [Gemmatimonadaceae bacterium]